MKNKVFQVLILQCDDSYRVVYETANRKKAYDYYNDYKNRYTMKIKVIESRHKKHGFDDIEY